MSKKCDLTGKQSITGNNVSHANNKTKRKFFPNLQSVSLYSEQLDSKLSFKVAASTLRTVEKSGGIDKFLLNTKANNLSTLAKKYKKNILKKIESNKAKTSQ
jgi:large subunit ribosomal protein L28|tara:strand:+ start:206 stop:511 length:306 start_codon:yes stop_codon:yes gene_type:complete